jgi:PAS domain S-box-containing protein
MIARSEPAIHATSLGLEDILNQPELVSLRRLTTLVEHLFRVPVAYMALLDHSCRVTTRIGSGAEYWSFLKILPIAGPLAAPAVLTDVALLPGADFGGIRFAASAPLHTSSGLELGLLVIADLKPRPEFSAQDLEALAELAAVLAGKMELRMVASQAMESKLALRETEARFRAVANATPVLIISGGPDGGCAFVNKTWLEFTGRCLEESLGDDWAEDVHPEDRPGLVEAYWRALQTRQAFSRDYRMRRHDGDYRRMHGRGTPHFWEDGTFAGFVGAVVDIEDQPIRHPRALSLSNPLAGPQVTVMPAVAEIDYQPDG